MITLAGRIVLAPVDAAIRFIGGAKHDTSDVVANYTLTLSGRLIVPLGLENEMYEVVQEPAQLGHVQYVALFIGKVGWHYPPGILVPFSDVLVPPEP